jgi:beta-lactamase regulating signal transducer with metallopeptidase domain
MVVTSLVTWLWQGLLVAGAAALLVRRLPGLNAATRHVIWWIALALVLLHPWTPSGVSFDPVPAGSGEPLAAAGSLFFIPQPPAWVMLGAALSWMCLVAAGVWRIGRSLAAVAAMKRESASLDPARERRLPLWSAARRTGRRCALRVSAHASGACALGFRRPVILLPAALVTSLSDEDLDQVILHEHAHLQRRDDWYRFVQCALAALVGVHPAIWFIGTQIDLEREAACDDRVVARTRAPRQYADCLARVAAHVAGRREWPAFVPAVVTRSSAMLRSRVTRLLDRGLNRTSRLGWAPALVSLLALTAVVLASDRVPPVVIVANVPDVSSLPVPVPAAAPSSDPAAAPRTSTLPDVINPATAAASRPMRQPLVPASTTNGGSVPSLLVATSTTAAPVLGRPLALDPPAPQNFTPPASAGTTASPATPPGDLADRQGSWSAVGSSAARAGSHMASRVQRASLNIGAWFTGAAKAAAAPTRPREAAAE